jgi:hypothetical protein
MTVTMGGILFCDFTSSNLVGAYISLLASCFTFDHEDGGNTCLRNGDKLLKYTA